MVKALEQFTADSDRLTADLGHRGRIRSALAGYYRKRDDYAGRFASWDDARAAAAKVKYEAVNHLDRYLKQFTSVIEGRGAKVFFAADAARARDYIVNLAVEKGAERVVKSKTMTSEEIHLNAALEKAGVEPFESDLGEYIVQLRGEAPYHFVFPAMHLSKRQISDLFEKELGTPATDDAEALAMTARKVMRQIYCQADIGVTGANFIVADAGMVSVTENEGNSRLTAALPRVHVVLVGIEKVVPKLSDLALLLPMLATAGAGQPLTCYNSMYAGPKTAGEPDGPDELHVVLLDNGRTALLADAEQRDALHCIRCGACLNVCPVFKNVGGHTYGTTYQGPIGSVITPHYQGLQEWKHLSNASSLCGACTSVCPVKIDLHHHLLHNRRNAAAAKPSLGERAMMRGFAFVMRRPRLYRLVGRLGWLSGPARGWVSGSRVDPMRAWTKTRDLPPVARESFRDWWGRRQQASGIRHQPEPDA